MAKGVVRKIDELGRVTIPKEMRKSFHMDSQDLVDIYAENGVICLKRETLQCVICGNHNESTLKQVRGVHLCSSCMNEIKEK